MTRNSDVDGFQVRNGKAGSGLVTFISIALCLLFICQPALADENASEFDLAVRGTQPLDPEAERLTFVLPEGFEVTLVASEPDIDKPMNMSFDAKGRLWVSSSVEYPYAATTDAVPRDTIKILEDTTGDGHADKITTFADKLNIPMGLYPYRDGVICFSIPNILYLRDTDGDGKADLREVLYGPMDTTRDTHGMCNAFTRGLDGWLYACHGFNNQTTVAGRDGHQVTMHSGNTFRMRPDGSRVEHFTHGQVNPFGMAMRPEGDLFTADCHTKPISLLLKNGYYESFGKPHDGLGFVPNMMEHLHGSTAIGGIALYHASEFPDAFYGNSFHGNVMTSRVNRNFIQQVGSSFAAIEQADFLVSGDPWFRPVDLQVGPDGALYVADFYNRIIGHYEVPLTHPGRDRHRGRIWKIAYVGNAQHENEELENANHDDATQKSEKADDADRVGRERHDVSHPGFVHSNVNHHNPSEVAQRPWERHNISTLDDAIQSLTSENLVVRMLATDALTDRWSDEVPERLSEVLRSSRNPHAIVHAAWVLFRRQRLSDAEIRRLVESSSSFVRTHVYRILGCASDPFGDTSKFLLAGVRDSDPLARRAAVMASAVHPDRSLVEPLLKLHRDTSGEDVHLKHAIRMSLKAHLQNDAWFLQTVSSLASEHRKLLGEICLAIKTEPAAEFLVSELQQIASESPQDLSKYVGYAARYAPLPRIPDVVAIGKVHYGGDAQTREELLTTIRKAVEQRGEELPTAVRDWAVELASQRLAVADLDASVVPIAWTSVQSEVTDSTIWNVSTIRNSADGEVGSRLHSSFPAGESKTGVLRSAAFKLPKSFQFYMAGHDGDPGQPIGSKNFVRVCEAATGKTLNQWSPPRADIAQAINWESGDSEGKDVYVDLVDGNDADAYAWIAAGRFSVGGLNPLRLTEDWGRGAEIVAEFQLFELREALVSKLRNGLTAGAVANDLSKAVVRIDGPNAIKFTFVESLSIFSIQGELRQRIVDHIINETTENDADTLMAEIMGRASFPDQRRLADSLVSDATGADLLLRIIEAGKGSVRLLKEPAIDAKLSTVLDETSRQQVKQLVASLPESDDAIPLSIERIKNSFVSNPSDAVAGRKVFKGNCSVCHQVAGEGKQAGPNLDGIGKRGLDRLLEDILMPNQNVDVAFRSSLVLTDDGVVQTGFVKQTDGNGVILIDSKGVERQIDSSSIEELRMTTMSPMPSNLHEALSSQQMLDLLSYLLSLP
ncbi:PVC-type heme-binding CxxCH protein [Rubripirellula amarantea]|nr:PVC-type heme-binding CxxCH protein [Rubripirellula amarantea]